MIADDAVFYNHWESDSVFKIPLFQNDGGGSMEQQRTLKSIDILKVEDNNPNAIEQVFEVLIGTEDGHILHGAIESKATRAGNIEVIKPFSSVIETSYESISDIKIAQINSFVLVLAVSETMLYQFAGKDLD